MSRTTPNALRRQAEADAAIVALLAETARPWSAAEVAMAHDATGPRDGRTVMRWRQRLESAAARGLMVREVQTVAGRPRVMYRWPSARGGQP
jgi:hypothetical protein